MKKFAFASAIAFLAFLAFLSYLSPANAAASAASSASASAIKGCASNNCALACNRLTHTCGLYSPNHIPVSYLRVSYLPHGYHRDGTSQCGSVRCPTGSSTCLRWGITHKAK